MSFEILGALGLFRAIGIIGLAGRGLTLLLLLLILGVLLQLLEHAFLLLGLVVGTERRGALFERRVSRTS